MRLNTKTRYGIRALYDLAFHSRGGAAQARDIAERQGVPLRFLEQILQDLRRAGLVEGKRGPRGGYSLAKAPEAVRVGDIVRVLEGPVDRLLSLEEDTPGPRSRGAARAGGRRPASSTPDVTAAVWGDVAKKLVAALDEVTLADFIKRAEILGVRREAQAPTMYFI